MAQVLYEQVSEHISTITLNDPDNLNAMGEEMAAEFAALTSKLKGEGTSIRAIIITGAGRAFSAGGNLQMLEKKTELSKEENKRRMLKFYDSFLGILSLGIPLVAAINGHAIGAGLCVASACDIRIAGEKAKLGFTFTKLGLHPGMGATYFLPKVIGYSAATELMTTGRVITAEEALHLGLVAKVVPNDDVLKEAILVSEEIAECGPLSVRQLLESVRVGASSLSTALDREAR